MQMTASDIVLVAVRLLFFVPRLPLQIFNQRIERKRAVCNRHQRARAKKRREREQRRKKTSFRNTNDVVFEVPGWLPVFVCSAYRNESVLLPPDVIHSLFQQLMDDRYGK